MATRKSKFAKYIGIAAIVIFILLFRNDFKRFTNGRLNIFNRPDATATAMSELITKSLDEFQNRKIYRTLDLPTIRQIPDDKLEQAIIDFVDLKIGKDFEHTYEIVTKLSPGFQAIYTTWILEGEVNNGGFQQFFWNSSGEFALEALDGFARIGAEKHYRLMEQAIATFIREEPQQRQFKEIGTIEAFSESYKHTDLVELDDQFYEIEEIGDYRIKYIRAHPEEFFGSID